MVWSRAVMWLVIWAVIGLVSVSMRVVLWLVIRVVMMVLGLPHLFLSWWAVHRCEVLLHHLPLEEWQAVQQGQPGLVEGTVMDRRR